MKKMYFFGLVTLALVTSIIWSCQEDNENIDQETLQSEIEAPQDLISFDQAKAYYDNYQLNRAGLIEEHEREVNKKANFSSAKYIEWDIETIENYLAYLRQEANKANVDLETIRIYYGQHGADLNNEETMFWVPTTEHDGLKKGFSIDGFGKVGLINNKGTTASKGGGSLILNYGQCCCGDPACKENNDF